MVEALAQLEKREFNLIMTDLKMQGQSGLDLLEKVLADDPQQCIIMMTAHGSVDSAVEAMRKGADLTIKGVSGRGTQSTDQFSLKGLAQALDKIEQECK